MWLLFIFIAIPLIEIALFIQVGGAIGLWATLAIVVVTAIVGTTLMRQQGIAEFGRLQGAMRGLEDPTEPLVHGAMILFSGALLLTPGFFTDAVGFALLAPPVRRWLHGQIRARMTVMSASQMHSSAGPRVHPDPGVVEGEFEEVKRPDPTSPSGWTRH